MQNKLDETLLETGKAIGETPELEHSYCPPDLSPDQTVAWMDSLGLVNINK